MKKTLALLILAAGAYAQQPEWIWFPEGKPAESAPEGARYFRKAIEVQGAASGAWIWIAADNAYELYLNGKHVGDGSNWRTPGMYPVAELLQPGNNAIAVKATNTGNAAGLLVAFRAAVKIGAEIVVASDATWKTSDTEQPDWMQPAFNDAAWKPALALGKPPLSPWHEIEKFGNLLSASLSNDLITPNGDTVQDTITISFAYPLGDRGRVEIQVRDAANVTVERFAVEGKKEGAFVWNGKYPTGGVAADGAYRVLVMAQSKTNETSQELKMTVKNVDPWPEIENTMKTVFPIGVWFDGRVEGINCPEGCNNVPNGLDKAATYYATAFNAIAQRGIEVVVIPNTPPDYRETLLKAADRARIRVIPQLVELAYVEFGGKFAIPNPEMERDEMAIYKELSRITRPLQRHSSLLAYYLADEPAADLFEHTRAVARILSNVDQQHPALSCLCNPADLPKASELGLQALLYDQYPLNVHMNPGDYDYQEFIAALDAVSANAKGIPYWMVLQAFAKPGVWRYPSAAELRLMTYLAIAHNAKGVFFFLYNSKTQQERLEGLADVDFKPAPLFDAVAQLAGELKALKPLLLTLVPIECTVTREQAPIDVRMFLDPQGRKFILANNLDVVNATTLAGFIPEKAEEILNLFTGGPVPLEPVSDGTKFTVPLAAGHGCFLRLK